MIIRGDWWVKFISGNWSVVPDPTEGLRGGYPVLTSYQYRAASSTDNAGFYPDQFNTWTTGGFDSNANAPVVSGDGKSITFSRTTPNDLSNARSAVQFQFGPRWAGESFAISFEVSGLDENAGGVRDVSCVINEGGLTGDTSRAITGNGVYGLIAASGSNATTTTVQIGFGVAGNDTKTNSITISNVMFTSLQSGQTKPALFGDITPWGAWRDNPTYDLSNSPDQADRHGISGYVLPDSLDWTYNPTTGEMSNPIGASTGSTSYKHIQLITDSFGNFLGGYTRELFYGGINGAPNYVVSVNASAGRQLEDIAPSTSGDTLISDIQNHQVRPDAYKPGFLVVQMGVNDFCIDAGNAAVNVLAYAQEYIDYAQANNMLCIMSTATPFANTTVTDTSWSAGKQVEVDAYNTALLALDNGTDIRVINTYDLLDTTGDDAIDAGFDLGDGLHVNAAGNAVLYNAYDSLINQIIAEQ